MIIKISVKCMLYHPVIFADCDWRQLYQISRLSGILLYFAVVPRPRFQSALLQGVDIRQP